MTVTTILDRQSFPGDGANKNFPFNFKFFNNAEIFVYLIDAAGVVSGKTLNVDYTLSGALQPNGGQVVMGTAPASTDNLLIMRVLPATQPSSIRNQGAFFPAIHEDVFDRLTMLIQQAIAGSNDALKLALSGDRWDFRGVRGTNAADPVDAQDVSTKNWTQQYIASILQTGQGPINNAANVIYVYPDSSIHVVQDLAGAQGSRGIGYRGYNVYDRFSQVVNIKDAPFNVKGDGTTLDQQNLVACLDYAAAQGLPVVVPARPGGIPYDFNNWIPLPDKLKIVFEPGAQWRLVGATVLGGFVCGGYTQALVPRPFTNAEIYGMDLDCNNQVQENGFNALNGVNIKIYNLKVRNVRFSPTTQGGKAIQFEGATVDGVHVYNPYIENCTIGINSHADPAAGAEVARFITYYDVVMRNVDVPFNIDGQFANPENGVVTNMSTTVLGVNLFNCGKLTFPGNSGALGGGIICGDRGFGLKVSGLRLVNTTAYGAIGGVFRGTMFGVVARDFLIQAPTVTNVIDWTPVGYGVPSTGGHPCTVDARDINVFAGIGLIAKGYANAKMGSCRFEVTIDSTLGLTGICDLAAAASATGFLDLILRQTGSLRTGMQSLNSLFTNGNNTNLCLPERIEGVWTPNDGSGAGIVLGNVSAYFVREGRRVTANFSFDVQSNSSGVAAKFGNLPFTAMNRPEAGAVTIAFKAAASLVSGRVLANTKTFDMLGNGATIPWSALSGQTLIGSVSYLCQ